MSRLFSTVNETVYLVAIIGIVALLYGVLDRYHPRLDLTQEKLYTLSPQTKKVLRHLKKPVTVTAYTRPGTSEANRLKGLLEEYHELSKQLTYKLVDVDRARVQALQAGIKKINTVVFTSGDRTKTIQPEDIFGFGVGNQQQFKGEGSFTSAILELTEGSRQTLCFVTGHGEKEIEGRENEGLSSFEEGLKRENYNPVSLPLAQKKKLSLKECSGVAILGPTAPYLSEEETLLKHYLKRGGKLLVALDPLRGTTLPLLKDYGVTPEPGKLVLDPTRSIALRGPASLVPVIGDHPAVKVLRESRTGVYFFEAMPLKLTSQGSTTPTPLFQTSTSAYTKEVSLKKQVKIAFDPKHDKRGQVVLGAAVQKGKTRLVVLGDSDFLSNALVRDLGNLDTGINIVNWLLEKEQNISIRPKTAQRRTLNLQTKQLHWMAWTVLLFTPLSFFIIAGFLFWKRRTL